MEQIEHKYFCDVCEYSCNKHYNWTRHLDTKKHRNMIGEEVDSDDTCNELTVFCKYCDKKYKSTSGVWYHQNRCKLNPNINSNDTIKFQQECIMQLIQDNKEFKSLLVEFMKNGTNTINNNVNNNNCHNNNNFNLQFFLNEQCKDAIDINEFVNSIQVTIADLEETGRLGYAEGISRIIINNLKQLDVHKRPIHCSDLKRNMLYIRHSNAWEKDKEKPNLMKNMIDNVAMKNIGQLQNWKNMYPGCDAYNSHKKDTYLTIVQNSMNGSSEEEQQDNANKIIKNVAKEVIIDKNK